MITDIDSLMKARGFDAVIVTGETAGNHILHYLTRGAKVTHATLIKKHGEQAVLLCNGMERDEAAKSGLPVVTTADFNFTQLFKQTGSVFEAELQMLAAVFERYGISGTVSFYGVMDPGRAYRWLNRLAEILPDVNITGETETTIFDEAYATKDAAELEAIRSVAERTNRVMGEVINFIRGHRPGDGYLVRADSLPLTVGDVKRVLRERLMAYDLSDDHTTIFAIGRDAGVPHSRGEDNDALTLGRSIIFDLFPRCARSGYYHDMTRTFCLGYAPDAVQRVYDHVMQAFNAVMGELEIGRPGGDYQDLTCDIFEEYGHPTPRSQPGTETGYVHNLGHGLGLQIHSRPRLGMLSKEVLKPGQVFTVEPGLYYPDQGFGVRIEDTVYVDENGNFHNLTTYPKGLVIPVE